MTFKTFRSTVTPPVPQRITPDMALLLDPNTGSPMGFQTTGANGPDAMFVPVDLTAAQIATPPALVLADLNSVFRLNVAPYTRYISNGTALVTTTSDIASFFAALPNDDSGLNSGDMFWNGGFLCKKA